VTGGPIHHAAARGFEAAADRYDSGRPGYPGGAVSRLVRELGMATGAEVVELGAGTGKLTELLVPTGAHITAIEPVAAMREALSRTCPSVVVADGTAERIPLPDASADALVAAQSFHWFDGERALPEIHRVLRPRGRLGLIWNVRDERARWSRRLTAIFDRLAGDGPRYRDGSWRAPFDRAGLFGPLHHFATDHVHRVSPRAFLDRVLSVSYVASAAEGDRERVVDEVNELLGTDPDLAGREEITMRYRTDAFWCERR
jgi:SAM-dependent methyltransferase